ncbi:asparaginase domain-containing protein [uncultured Formosa sp.]|uniref:asparaginase domain-containing protein n=1 Tax=uncultured Formosa sp. TaxID=255435 RepID=UPI0026022125|nr:asparaginase domain-containing protein [uncultured Formosa sp.]
MKLIFIQTGGTIDKEYPHTTKGWAFEFGAPATIRILEKLNPSFKYEIVTACQKDSLEITDDDRTNLAKLINKYPERKFIVTHGTDTMIETAKFLEAHVKNKLIVITGAMLPERFYTSDAPIQLGTAIATANLIDTGVYIAMHGIVKRASDINRNLETGQYY